MTNKYYVFMGFDYYPLGGWDDFKGEFESGVEALKYIAGLEYGSREEWAQIVYDKKIIIKMRREYDYYKGINFIPEWIFEDVDI